MELGRIVDLQHVWEADSASLQGTYSTPDRLVVPDRCRSYCHRFLLLQRGPAGWVAKRTIKLVTHAAFLSFSDESAK
ncbi:hypothetical protein ColLi_05279 [Colletotrichum liriopes]|uniref:Uncharacterized protein n=1 Tax=Colletotrichum liriopes TaxID=708192 RepID=A0AA37GK07_9PEZI|nr:hypothetical protein ColLi_05279 [Colletotrichum liriopes]